jgi:hypothetical protein
MSLLKAVEEELRGVPLSPVIRPPVDFNEPNEELAVFAMRLYAYSSIAHIRTILGGLVVLDDAGNTPSAELLCRHVFEWNAHASYMVSNLEPHVKQGRWVAAFQVVSNFNGANSWIRQHGGKYGAIQIQLEAPDAVRLKHWINAYEKFRTEEYGTATVKDGYGYPSEHSHPSAACFLQYRDIQGAEIRFVQPAKASHLPDLDCCLIDWLRLTYAILVFAKEGTVRTALLRMIEKVVTPVQG